MSLHFRSAQPEDAPILAELVNMSAEGMPLAFWEDQSLFGQAGIDVGIERCAEKDSATSYVRISLAMRDAEVVGMILSYQLAEAADMEGAAVHPLFRPIVRFAPLLGPGGTINTMAVYPKHRRKGIGTAMLKRLEDRSSSSAQNGLLMTDVNGPAHAFCDTKRYGVVDEMPLVKGPWRTTASTWQLRRKLHS